MFSSCILALPKRGCETLQFNGSGTAFGFGVIVRVDFGWARLVGGLVAGVGLVDQAVDAAGVDGVALRDLERFAIEAQMLLIAVGLGTVGANGSVIEETYI